MADNRKDQFQGPSTPCPPLLPAETLRSTASPPPAKEEGKEEKGIPMVWRIFGGTILSIGALIAVTLYQQLFSKVEALGDLAVKKDEFYKMRKGIWDQIEKLRGSEQGVDGERLPRLA